MVRGVAGFVACETCEADGTVRCPDCGGRGIVAGYPCPRYPLCVSGYVECEDCDGLGRVRKDAT